MGMKPSFWSGHAQLEWQKQSLAHPHPHPPHPTPATFPTCVIRSRMTPAYGGLGSLAQTTGDIQTSTHLILLYLDRGFKEEASVGFLQPHPYPTVFTFASCSPGGCEGLC